jgi:flavodoxin
MKKVLIAYFSATGTTEKMAEYIAEGIRISGQGVMVRKTSEVKAPDDLAGYDGYIFGAPTYSLDVPEPMKKILLAVERAGLDGKLGGSFGSYSHDVAYKHDAYAPAIIYHTLQTVSKMEPFELGPLTLREDMVATSEGMKACHDYGRVFGEKLGS